MFLCAGHCRSPHLTVRSANWELPNMLRRTQSLLNDRSTCFQHTYSRTLSRKCLYNCSTAECVSASGVAITFRSLRERPPALWEMVSRQTCGRCKKFKPGKKRARDGCNEGAKQTYLTFEQEGTMQASNKRHVKTSPEPSRNIPDKSYAPPVFAEMPAATNRV